MVQRLALASLFASSLLSAQRPDLTVEWLYSSEPATLSALPDFLWRADGRALWRARGGTLEVVDPRTDERTPATNRARSLASLQTLSGETRTRLPWPEATAASGNRSVHAFDGDVYVLDFGASEFYRLTDTPAREQSASIAPDGSRVAFVRDNDLYVVDVESGRERRLTTDGSDTVLNGTLSWVYWEEIFGRRDIGFWWSPDSRAIAFLRTDESMVSEVVFSDFEPATPRVIRQRYPKAGTANPTVRVGVVRLDDGDTTFVDLDPKTFEYVARLKWLPDGEQLGIQTMTRDQRSLTLWIAGLDGKPREVLTETDRAWVNIHDDLYFLEDGEHFVWASERDGYNHLYRFTLDGELVNQITKGEWSTRSSGGGVFWLRQVVSAIDEDDGYVYFTALEKSSVERHLYRIRFDGSGMERLTTRDGTHQITFSPDANYYFDAFSTISTLPELSLHRADGTLVKQLATGRRDALAKFDLPETEIFRVPARDGFEMPAQLLKPRDFDATKRYPVVVHVYGGPSAPTVKDAWSNGIWWDQLLAQHGFLVFKVDNRAATAISKELESSVLGRLIGDGELNDFVDAARWLKAQRYVDPDRIGVWGWSGGGSMTLLCLTRSEEFKAGIAVAAVTDWHFYDTKWAEFAMKLPTTNSKGYAYTSLVSRAKDLHGRLLLVHGTYDDNVHPQNMWAFVDALVTANKPFDLMVYPMRKHGIADRAARIHLYSKMLEFWKLRL